MPDIRMDSPNAKQREFFLARERFVAYGGARGGGKSWAVRKKATLLALRYPGIRILILRRTFPELRENHILPLAAELLGVAVYRDMDKAFTFPGGSRIKFGYCAAESDVLQYQGQEYDVIFLDEATQFTEFQFSTLTACMRGANQFPKRFYLTCNPGGVGHAWVKRLFIDKDFRQSERPEDYRFIPAKVYDNKALMEQDQGYLRMLENLPEELREAWLNGNWDVFAGQYFREFDRGVHVVEPFEIPKAWRKYFVMDYGLDMFAGYFIALDDGGKAYVYRELYESGLIISEMLKRIQDAADGENIYAYLAPPDMWNRRQDTGQSVAELAEEAGITFEKAQNDRVMGWLALKEWLRVDTDEFGACSPHLRIFRNCPNLIKSIPLLQFDSKNPNDVSRQPHDITHGPDALRYFIAGRPIPAAKAQEKTIYNFDFEKPKQSPLGKGGKELVI